jgi:hypothetical protein
LLSKLTHDFARAIEAVDAEGPTAVSVTTGKFYQPGIGPHTESATLSLVKNKLGSISPAYRQIETHSPYPCLPRQKCDWCWTCPTGDRLYIEAKLMRLMGDNGKPNDNILCHILSPYPQQRSALTDCQKLANSGFDGSLVILICGYEYPGYPLWPVIDAFQSLASKTVNLSEPSVATFGGLMHPVHKQGGVYAWTLQSKGPSVISESLKVVGEGNGASAI